MYGTRDTEKGSFTFSNEREELFRKKFPPAKGFRVPEGYFDSLSANIRRSIESTEHKPRHALFTDITNMLRRAWIPVSLLAALFIAFIVFFPGRKSGQQTVTESSVASAGLSSYDESYAGEAIAIEAADLSDEIENSNADPGLMLSKLSQNDTTLSKTDIINYLNQQDIDPELLAEL